MQDKPFSNVSNQKPVQYLLELKETEKSTGFFAVRPKESQGFEQMLEQHRRSPSDEFMRKHLAGVVGGWAPEQLKTTVVNRYAKDLFALSIFYDACLLHSKFDSVRKYFDKSDIRKFPEHSPLILVRSHGLKHRPLHAKWIRRFRENIFEHRPMAPPDEIGLASPCASGVSPPSAEKAVSIEELIEGRAVPPVGPGNTRPAPEETFEAAVAALEKVGIIAGEEMRHVASLSPIALLRKWNLNVSVDCGRHRYDLSGVQTSYGRGLALEAARAAYAMEMLERYASFACVGRNEVTGYETQYPLVYARRSEMKRNNRIALDPDRLCLEVPYRDEPIYWIEGQPAGNVNPGTVWVPAQSVFLFFNLDEIKLYSGLGSTGLAAGNTLSEAKAGALLEIVERDCEAVSPYDPAKCFDVETADSQVNSLLYNYAEAGIRVQFQDLTPPMGIPCCKCFVVADDGEIAKGTGAHLDARRALLSAMTETPYPFPYGPPSGAGPEKNVRVPLENLPNYSSQDPEQDLALLETLLIRNGYQPIYVDLTRKDTRIPVVRAIVPGMETNLDFDIYSRVPSRLYSNYLTMHGK